MTPFEIVLLCFGAVLALSALPVIHRMVAGPTILDRAVAADMFMILMVFAFALVAAWTRTTWAFAPMLMLTAMAFIGTIAVARFVVREEPASQRRHRTWTGPVPSMSTHLRKERAAGAVAPSQPAARAQREGRER